MSSEHLFTVVVPTHNRGKRLARCLKSLRSLEGAPEIIVVDDGSNPPIEDCGPGVLLLQQPHKGPAAARNLGASRATGKYLAFTDDDCVVDPKWLQSLHTVLIDRPDTLIGGKIRNGEPHNWAAAFNQELLDQLRKVTEGTRHWFLPSNNLCLSMAAFARMGGFDESFLSAGGEDREFCERWTSHGGELAYVAAAVVEHHHPQRIREFWAMHKRYGAAALRLARSRPTWAPEINRRVLYRAVSRRQPISRLLLSQLAVLAGYLEARADDTVRFDRDRGFVQLPEHHRELLAKSGQPDGERISGSRGR